jgi:hypothetical protein
VSDEAFALLLIDNSEARWMKLFEAGYEGGPIPSTKYTFKGSSKVGTGCTTKFHGWSRDGLMQFNDLCSMVLQDRKLHDAMFDHAFQVHWNQEHTKTKVQKNNWGQPITVYNDLFEAVDHNHVENIEIETKNNNAESGNSDGKNVEEVSNAAMNFAVI